MLALWEERRLWEARNAGIPELAPLTVHRILTRHGMPRFAWLERPTGIPVRYERARPGELVQVHTKKRGRSREGCGWRVHGRIGELARRQHALVCGGRVGLELVHTAVDKALSPGPQQSPL